MFDQARPYQRQRPRIGCPGRRETTRPTGQDGAMASFETDGTHLVLRLSAVEKAAAVHGDLRFERDQVREVRTVKAARREVRGLRLPGSHLPGAFTYGSYRQRGGAWTFAACRGRGPGVVVELDGHRYQRIVVTTGDGEAARERLTGPESDRPAAGR